MLIIEYDVNSDGLCEVLAVIDAYAEDGLRGPRKTEPSDM